MNVSNNGAKEWNVNTNPTDAKVCRYLFTVKLLYMFRVSQQCFQCGIANVNMKN